MGQEQEIACGVATDILEAVNTASHLINRGPSTPLNFKLPEEVWSSKKVDLSYLKVFCCVSYVYVDSSARSKLDAKPKKYYFVGYGDSEFGYRLWDDQNWKIARSKDLVFNEAILYKDRASSSKAKKPEGIPSKNSPKYEVSKSSGIKDQETQAPEKPKPLSLLS